ncbi:hypothetical protein MKW98_021598 [Papaver atlanticum]|uniref:Chalcone synthase n=1 Tax=Papaver atlanticum TaxID=357466 RepID=A0AAD4T9C1_9MAGN|nr:hypothetical protein MKW98_021598 [Papaver atlanticum]
MESFTTAIPTPVNQDQQTRTATRRSPSTQGFATVLAIGTATPPDVFYQDDYPDFFFKLTNSDHKTELKDKFKRICAGSKIKKRHLHSTEEIMKEFPDMGNECMTGSSLDVRQEIMAVEIPKLAKEASLKAIEEWGQPKSKITHLVVTTLSCLDLPGVDHHLSKLLGLKPTVRRFGLYNHGCYAGGSALRLAKDIAENNAGARILVVSSELSSINIFTGPSEEYLEPLVCQALFSDGASALIVGSDPESFENPLFEVVSAYQTLIPDSDYDISGAIRQVGAIARLSKRVPELVASNIEECLKEAFTPFGISDWNSLFWIAHPGGPLVLRQIELKLGLTENKMGATYKVLSEYGNMLGACLYFSMDEMRKKSIKEAKSTTGEGLEWGVALGFGPGLTVETLVLRSVPINMPTQN